MIRRDLAALDATKLAALANRGLVKRAEKELATGPRPQLTLELDGTLVAVFEGATTRIPIGRAIGQWPCTCGVPHACRHRIAAVLAYRASIEGRVAAEDRDVPRGIDDASLRDFLGRTSFGRALKLREAGYAAQVRGEDASIVELPTCTVRFLAPDDLAYVRCDCDRGGRCEHVALAVWALRDHQANVKPNGGARVAEAAERYAASRERERGDVGDLPNERAEDALAGENGRDLGPPGVGESDPTERRARRSTRTRGGHRKPIGSEARGRTPVVDDRSNQANDRDAIDRRTDIDRSRSDAAAARRDDPNEPSTQAIAQLGPALDLAQHLLLDGSSAASTALAAQFARVKKPIANLAWPLALCEELEDLFASYTARAAEYHPEAIADRITELAARARAAAHTGETRATLGTDEPAESALDRLRLVSLGARVYAEPAGEAGRTRARCRIFLADPDTGNVLVLPREWDLSLDELGPALGVRRALPGVSLGQLARGQLVTKLARRRVNRTLVIARGRVGQSSFTPQRGEWAHLGEPLFSPDVARLARMLRTRPPWFARPRIEAEHVHALPIGSVRDLRWRSGTQRFEAELEDPTGQRFRVARAHSAAAPTAIDALAATLGGQFGPPRFISGEVRPERDGVCLDPTGVVADRVVVPDLEDEPEHVPPLPPIGVADERDPLIDALRDARAELDRGAHRGLRFTTDEWRESLRRGADRLAQLGLRSSAELLRDVAARSREAQIRPDPERQRELAQRWLDASLRIRLALAS